MTLFVDATTLISLGSVDELGLLRNFDSSVAIPPAVQREVTTEPAATNLRQFLDIEDVREQPVIEDPAIEEAREILGEEERNGDVEIVAAVVHHAGERVGVVSDDRRVRTTARSLGARVTGTVGVVVQAVEEGLSAEEGKQLVRRIDSHGLHLTGELRERALELVVEAADR